MPCAVVTLPAAFVRKNEEDAAWLAGVPALVAELAERWSLTLGPPFPNIAINFVAPATRADGTACVFKLSRHVDETRTEIAALELWDGNGSARLFAAEPDLGALLVERLEPGTMLNVAVPDEDAATRIAAGILRRLWQPDPAPETLRSLSSWCAAYDRNRASILRGDTGFPVDLFRRADALRRELLESAPPDRPLHGDLHHFNILRAQRAEWLSIDPKGLQGDPHFDVCQYLVNPQPNIPHAAINRRRLDIFCSELGLDRARAAAWCVVHAVLNACWYFEEGRPWQAAVAYAEQTLTF